MHEFLLIYAIPSISEIQACSIWDLSTSKSSEQVWIAYTFFL